MEPCANEQAFKELQALQRQREAAWVEKTKEMHNKVGVPTAKKNFDSLIKLYEEFVQYTTDALIDTDLAKLNAIVFGVSRRIQLTSVIVLNKKGFSSTQYGTNGRAFNSGSDWLFLYRDRAIVRSLLPERLHEPFDKLCHALQLAGLHDANIKDAEMMQRRVALGSSLKMLDGDEVKVCKLMGVKSPTSVEFHTAAQSRGLWGGLRVDSDDVQEEYALKMEYSMSEMSTMTRVLALASIRPQVIEEYRTMLESDKGLQRIKATKEYLREAFGKQMLAVML